VIRLQWVKKQGFGVRTYQLFRSMVGVHFPQTSMSSLSGKTLMLAVDGRPVETVLFSGLGSVAEQINEQISRGTAYPAHSAAEGTFFRSPTGVAPGSVEVVGGTSLPVFGISAGLRTERSAWHLVCEIPGTGPGSDEAIYFHDHDGTSLDYYSIRTISLSGEGSRMSPPTRPLTGMPGPICVISGSVSDAQGVYLKDVKVSAIPLALPSFVLGTALSKKAVVALTDAYGKFNLPLLQGSSVILDIEETGYSRTFTVPLMESADIADLASDFEHRYPLNTEV
jgi:hypothetical protein